MSFVLVVRMTTREGAEDEALEILRELAPASRAEPGCDYYIPARDPENPRSILIFEQYHDQAAFEAHGATEHFQRLAAGRLFPLMESRERSFYETVVP
jgi:quinol monooxygenase YgiN